ncbi:multiple cyclophane-containing RiPP AmcA [Plantactinospora sp. KBS50]|uniref:multiple cyclophane-containing RiPP AmcA n=1 Tax=Plantactinospora sp. KBS50 TaxID=2024580 RepID=UPI0018DF4822|nr:multiple cyclophane-containing RiPP AmcA [Plantactinospora sp. KBS50]
MTVYVSRNAVSGAAWQDRPAKDRPREPPGSADPPLLTHAWRIVFAQRARQLDRR